MRRLVGCISLLLLGCPGSSQRSSPDAMASANPAPPSTMEIHTPDVAVRALVRRWNDALDRHDVDALAKIYAPDVKLYTRDMKRSAVLEAKRHAFKTMPTFRQSIVGEIALESNGPRWTATFTKHSGPVAKQTDVRAKLVLGSGDELPLFVFEETDETTEKNVAARKRECEATVMREVEALPEVKKDHAFANEAGATWGGLGPIDEDDGGFTASFGVHHPERYEAHVWLTVRANGSLSVSLMGEEIKVPDDVRARIERVCKSR